MHVRSSANARPAWEPEVSKRITGILLLMIGGVMAIGGAENGSLPIATFWLGLLLYPIGAYVFLRGNHHASRRRTRPGRRSLAQTTRGRS